MTRSWSAEELRAAAPSIYAERPLPGLSSRYSFVATAQVIEILRDTGWEPVEAREQLIRKPERKGFQAHQVRFARRVDLERQLFSVGSSRPEMVLQNAHDATRAYRIHAGLFRLVCGNGLVVSDTMIRSISIRHVDVNPDRFAEAARVTAEALPVLAETVRRWQAVRLGESQRREFSRKAVSLRWDPDSPIGRAMMQGDLTAPRRRADAAHDLWSVFNVAQEHLIQGGTGYVVQYQGRNPVSGTTRALRGLDRATELNKALWNLAEEFSRN